MSQRPVHCGKSSLRLASAKNRNAALPARKRLLRGTGETPANSRGQRRRPPPMFPTKTLLNHSSKSCAEYSISVFHPQMKTSDAQGFQMMCPPRLRRAWRIICDRVFMPLPLKSRDSRQAAPLPPQRRGHAATALRRTCPSCRVKGSCAARTCGASRRTRP